MSELPRGTVTFIFTDIEGSTRLLHALGDHYRDALEQHRTILRNAFTSHGGTDRGTRIAYLWVPNSICPLTCRFGGEPSG